MGKHPEATEKLWGVEFWSDGYFVKKQGTDEGYTQIYKKQLELFD